MSCNSSDQPTFCSNASPELKLYQAFIFSVPVFFTFILLLLFCVFYLRRRRASWQSLRMRSSQLGREEASRSSTSGIKKEVRELLPVVVFKESFLIRETQCSVCLADYQSDDRLQRIPQCGHTFHIDCIDHWLATHTTCPLCRVSLLPATKPSAPPSDLEAEASEVQQQQEQAATDADASRAVQIEDEAEAQERGRASDGGTEAEDSMSCCEGSVVIDINGHGSSQDLRS